MPVLSYIAYPVIGSKKELLKALSSLEFCEVLPSENREILVLVTDTPDAESEQDLQDKLKSLKHLQSLSMIFGHTDD